MLLKNYIYYTATVIAFLSILSIVFAVKNNDKKTNNTIRIYNVLSVIYMFVISVLHNFIDVEVGMEILIVWIKCCVGGLLYIISSIICLSKVREVKTNPKFNYIRYILYVLLLLPIILFIISYRYEYKNVLHGQILVTINANGGNFDSKEYTFVVNENYINEVSFDVDYSDNAFIRNNYKKITNEELGQKSIKIDVIEDFDNYYLVVYQNDDLRYKTELIDAYGNVSIDNIYYKIK